MRLKGKVAIVTGACRGIGRGIAEVFIEQGARVVIADRLEDGPAVADQLGPAAKFVSCDVSREASVNEMVRQTVETFGRVDVLVNNAGVNFTRAFDQTSSEDWDRVLSVDLRGVFLCTRACIDHFLRQGSGNVVTIASVHTLATIPGAATYAAAKWGVTGLMKALAIEYADRNVRFNCLSPGLIDTQIWADVQSAAEDVEACKAHWWANIPAGRVGTPREMGQVAAFLASDEASYVTGANLYADGGITSQLISRAGYASKDVEGR